VSNFGYRLFYRRNLPHYQPANATLFVTVRLAGSLPVEILRQLRGEYDRAIAGFDNTLSLRERSELEYTAQRRFFGRMDAFLDSGNLGPRWLEEPAIAQMLADSLHFRHGRVYDLDTLCIMPTHVHVVFSPRRTSTNKPHALSSKVQSLKGYTAHEANKILCREGAFWHHESYDHVIRDAEEHERIVKYILNNPVKASLIDKWQDWRWSYTKHQL
jgi:putative transposase